MYFLFSMFSVAHADIRIDMNPQGLKFRKGLDDDVSMRYSQHIYLSFRNDGNIQMRNYTPVKVRLGSTNTQGYIYGPAARGGSLGGPVYPGEVANVFIRLPLGTLKHCQRVRATIDSNRTHQIGPSVFGNDTKTFTVYEMGKSRLLCTVLLPRPRFPRLPRKRFPFPRP